MKRFLLIATTMLAGLLPMREAAAAASASARLDWTAFSTTLIDLTPLDGVAPAITLNNRRTSAFVTGLDEFHVADWVTPLSLAGRATFTADAGSITAGSINGGTAQVARHGDFTMPANSILLVSVPFQLAVDALDLDRESSTATVYLHLNKTLVDGKPGLLSFSTYEIGSHFSWGTLDDRIGVLTAGLVNTTASPFDASVMAYGRVTAVPEPQSVALMLAGLLAVAVVAARRVAPKR